MSTRTVGIFGGSFNPPHVAHVLAVVYALSVAAVDEVLVVPVYRHPFSKELVSFEHRLAMCEVALGWLPGVQVSDVERELAGESLTLRTLEHLRAQHADWSMRLVIGSDVVADLPKWHRWDRVSELAPPLVIERAGASDRPDDVLLPQLSSSEVRALFAARDIAALERLVPHRVLAYTKAHGLYGMSEAL